MIPDLQYLHISTTTACNLRCAHCAIRKPDYRGKHMTADTFDRMLPALLETRYVQLNGHGETLTHPGFLWMFGECARCECGVSFQSNGHLLTGDLCEALLRTNAWDTLTVSIDGATEETYRAIRGAKLAALVAKLAVFNDLRKKYATPPGLRFEFCMMRKNIHELPGVVKLARQLGAVEVFCGDLTEYPGMENESLAGDVDAIRPSVEQAEREAGGYVFVHFTEATTRALGRPVGKPAGCAHPWTTAFVDVDGNVTPCCRVVQSWGNVNERRWEDIWHGPEATAMREAFVRKDYPAECRGCNWVAEVIG
jgi:radical SAM protein with 4Fe4S-binding SPASM domain